MSVASTPQNTGRERAPVLIATVLAVFCGVLIALVAVLPAEYGYDPTGLGDRLGLTQLAPGAASSAPPAPADAGNPRPGRGSQVITLAPGEGRELKLNMLAGQKLSYRWIASRAIHVDLHGEPAGDTSGYYESYAIATTDSVQGQFTAVFDGTHGWYWRNDTQETVTIDLTYAGQFESRVE